MKVYVPSKLDQMLLGGMCEHSIAIYTVNCFAAFYIPTGE